jgi:hypothetical protein
MRYRLDDKVYEGRKRTFGLLTRALLLPFRTRKASTLDPSTLRIHEVTYKVAFGRVYLLSEREEPT